MNGGGEGLSMKVLRELVSCGGKCSGTATRAGAEPHLSSHHVDNPFSSEQSAGPRPENAGL